MVPAEIHVTSDQRSLVVHWDSKSCQTFSAKMLRANSRSAQTISSAIQCRQTNVDENITIKQVNAIGHYAINIEFSDGYTKGIYPWSLFLELTSN